ncbi:MAG: baseplate J/gp47 family protein, partial [Fusobacteriaceae bacterium]
MFKVKEEYEIKNEILQSMKNELSKIEGTYNYDIASATALEINNLYKEVEELHKQLFPWSVTQDYYLDLHMKFFGLTRREKTKATGQVTLKGKPTTVVLKGSVVISRVGQKYLTLQNATLGIDGIAIIEIEAFEGGEVGNCGIGDINSFEILITGVESVINMSEIEGGFEIESLESCKNRMNEKASRPAHSGNVFDYENWTKSVRGVGKVKVISAGEQDVLPGSVKVLIADYNLKPAPTELIQNVQEFLNTKKPVNDLTIVESFKPYIINIEFETVRVKKDSINEVDFIISFKNELQSNLLNQIFTIGDIISNVKIGFLALQIDGTIDYNTMTINGSGGNIPLSYDD